MDNLQAKAALMKKLLAMADDNTAAKLPSSKQNKLTPVGTDESQSPIRKQSDIYDVSVQYVEAARKSYDLKPSVVAATTENIELKGLQRVDGVKLAEGDRVLVKNQNKAHQNGIYVATSGNWSRSVDADEDFKMRNNPFTYVEEGNVNGSVSFGTQMPAGFKMDVTPVKFEVFKDKSPATSTVRSGATFSTFHKDITQSEGINDQGEY